MPARSREETGSRQRLFNSTAWITSRIATPTAQPAATARAHASHKGSYGDLAVVGGDAGMLGAALLAARAALRAGRAGPVLQAVEARRQHLHRPLRARNPRRQRRVRRSH